MWIIPKEELIVLAIVLAVGLVALLLWLAPAKPETAVAAVQPAPSATQEVPASSTSVTTHAAPVTPPTVVSAGQPAQSAYVEESASPSIPRVTAIDGMVYPGEYAHSTEAGGFEVYWTNDAQRLRVGLVSPGTGYVAIGFDPDSGMRGANFILGAVRDGRLWTRDDYGNDSLSHVADTTLGGTDDILEAAGLELDGRTYFEFVIPLNSGDPMDKPLSPGTTYGIVIAFHETNDDFDTYHSRRGAGSMRLDPG